MHSHEHQGKEGYDSLIHLWKYLEILDKNSMHLTKWILIHSSQSASIETEVSIMSVLF